MFEPGELQDLLNRAHGGASSDAGAQAWTHDVVARGHVTCTAVVAACAHAGLTRWKRVAVGHDLDLLSVYSAMRWCLDPTERRAKLAWEVADLAADAPIEVHATLEEVQRYDLSFYSAYATADVGHARSELSGCWRLLTDAAHRGAAVAAAAVLEGGRCPALLDVLPVAGRHDLFDAVLERAIPQLSDYGATVSARDFQGSASVVAAAKGRRYHRFVAIWLTYQEAMEHAASAPAGEAEFVRSIWLTGDVAPMVHAALTSLWPHLGSRPTVEE